jgi:endonuclease/exonuclease/phosphatase family metal-dependent hydrolase
MMEFGFTRKYINPVRRLIIWLEGLSPGPEKVETPREHFSSSLYNQGLNLNIMSFNIRRGTREDGRNHWIFRRHLVREVMERYRPDVLGLQEALDFQISAIRAMLPGYEKVGVGNLGGSRGLHTAIFYDAARFAVSEAGTFWFSATPHIPRSKGWGNIIPRTCTWARLIEKDSLRAFYCYNVHLDHLSQRSRKKSVVFLSRLIQARRFPDPFVLTGDFNAGEENASIRFLKGIRHLRGKDGGYVSNPEPLRDTFRDRYPDHPRVATYHGFRRFFFRFKFDYIFVPSSVQVREAKIIQLQRRKCYPSDHFPLLSRIVLPATRLALSPLLDNREHQ